MIVITPPVPVAGIEAPTASDATAPPSDTGTLVRTVPAAIANVTSATDPPPMTVLFNPKTTQVALPAPLEQDVLLPAAAAAPPVVTVTPVTADAE